MVVISLMRMKGIITPRPSPKLLRPLPQASRAKAWLSKHCLSLAFRRKIVLLPEVDDHKTHDVKNGGEYEDLEKVQLRNDRDHAKTLVPSNQNI